VGTAILGRYVLTRAIGQGGVSTVYSAVDARRGRLLAVKIFAPSDDGPAAGDDVRREALITDRLRHPSVPRVFEYGAAPLHDGTVMPYVVLELLSGVPLTERLAWGPLNWPEAVRIAATAADVLAVAHRRGVVHRDLSARNVMVTPHGIKIIDFGLATAAQAGLAAAAHPGLATAAHPGLATAVHPGMATAGHLGLADAGHPGLAAAEHPVTAGRTRPPSHPKTAFARPADDVYTLGVLLYEMVTGRSPYPPRTAGTIRMAGRVARLAPTPVMAVPGLPAEVRDLVRACMAKVPEHRPESARVALSLWSILERARVRTPEPSISR
jgi:serine/threonine-protein kinase